MSVRAQTAHPFMLFWHSFFPRKTNEVQHAVSSTDIASMPRQTQLLLAHCLERNDPYLTLQNGDTDAACLIKEEWLKPIECTTIGIACFRIKPYIWHQLKTSRHQFVGMISRTEIESYRKAKSANYPWLW